MIVLRQMKSRRLIRIGLIVFIPIVSLFVLFIIEKNYISSPSFSLYESGNYGIAANGICSAPNLSVDPSFKCLGSSPKSPNPLVFDVLAGVFIVIMVLDIVSYKILSKRRDIILKNK
jgi:hypothetical protein